jgi:hypothetical protein
MGMEVNKLSAVHVPPGMTATMFQLDNFQGKSLFIAGDLLRGLNAHQQGFAGYSGG